MDGVISAAQGGGAERQNRVFDITVRALKWLFHSLSGEAKESVSVKKLLDGEVDWERVKEFLRWIIDNKAGTVAIPERKLQELWDLLDTPVSQRRMGRKDPVRLVWNLRSMYLAVPGAVAHLYPIQSALAQVGTDRAWLSPASHREITDWKMLEEQIAEQPTHLAEIVRRKATHLGFCDTSGLGDGCVWLDLSRSGKDLVWHHPWPADIIAGLVSSTNREGTITNSDLELAALVLHEATLLASATEARMTTPRPGLDNTPIVSWSMKEASTINPVVAELLRLRALHSRQFFLRPSVFYHPGIENRMADDTSCLFKLSDTSLLAHMPAAYPQLQSLWQIYLLPLDLLSCVIFTLRRQPCEQELHKILASRVSTKQWSDFCDTLKINPDLQDSSVPRVVVLQVYEHCVRQAQYSKRRVDQLGKESVSQAWGAIAATHLLALTSQTPGSS